jgi:hypothetical protein
MLPLKKIFVIGLLLVLGYSQIGYYLVMLTVQYELKERMEHEILQKAKNEDLVIISLSDNGDKIYWEDKDEKNEFSFKGQMYDIVKTDTVNGRVLLYCLNDKKEQQLIDRYNSITKNNSAEDKKATKDFDTSITLFIWENIDSEPSFSFKTPRQCYFFDSRLAKGVPNNTVPPPKS